MKSDGSPDKDEDERLKQLRREYMPESSDRPGWSAGEMTSTGLELAMSVLVLALLGWWADKKFGTSPWLLLTGSAVGIVGGLVRLVQRTLRK
jgi:F0F1-type ATP synthase assembly protein I